MRVPIYQAREDGTPFGVYYPVGSRKVQVLRYGYNHAAVNSDASFNDAAWGDELGVRDDEVYGQGYRWIKGGCW